MSTIAALCLLAIHFCSKPTLALDDHASIVTGSNCGITEAIRTIDTLPNNYDHEEGTVPGCTIVKDSSLEQYKADLPSRTNYTMVINFYCFTFELFCRVALWTLV